MVWDWCRRINEIVSSEQVRYYAASIRHYLKLYPNDKKKVVVDNYKRHGGNIFKIFAEVRRINRTVDKH